MNKFVIILLFNAAQHKGLSSFVLERYPCINKKNLVVFRSVTRIFLRKRLENEKFLSRHFDDLFSVT